MPRTVLLVAALTLASAVPLHAQRRFRLGPAVSSMSLQDLSGASHSFTGYGGAVALITSDDGESGVSLIRYGDLGTDSRVRRLTLYALDSYYYPVGTRGIAPFAATGLGLARVTESTSLCLLLSCTDTVSPSSQVALAFGLGVRIKPGKDAAPVIEGRGLAALGTGVRRGRLPARRLLHRGPGPRHRSGAARRAGVRSHEWPDDLELQRPPAVAAAQVGGERVRRADRGLDQPPDWRLAVGSRERGAVLSHAPEGTAPCSPRPLNPATLSPIFTPCALPPGPNMV